MIDFVRLSPLSCLGPRHVRICPITDMLQEGSEWPRPELLCTSIPEVIWKEDGKISFD